MTAGLRVFWLITLCFFLSGCAGYRPAGIPRIDESGNLENDDKEDVIKAGDDVRVSILGGEVFKGTVVSIDRTTLTLFEEQPGLEEIVTSEQIMHVLSIAEVMSVHRYHSQKTRFALAGVGLVIFSAVVFSNIPEDLGLDWGD